MNMSDKINFTPANPLLPNVSHPSFGSKLREKKISDVYKEINTDLARDNLENDIPAADLQDL